MTALRIGARGRKFLLPGAIVVCFATAIAFAMTRDDARRPSAVAIAPTAQPAPAAATTQPAARAARTADEEAYIRALWPIHGEVQRNVTQMSLGQIFYKTQDMTRAELKVRVDDALAAFLAAESRLRALVPPASLREDHETYATAVRLFKDSAGEVRKMFADGRDDHMLAAYPGSQEGSDKIRDVGGKLWPHEFPAH